MQTNQGQHFCSGYTGRPKKNGEANHFAKKRFLGTPGIFTAKMLPLICLHWWLSKSINHIVLRNS